jgi:hypothetical protein
MVLWCRVCAALIGVRYPYHDWHVDRDAVCVLCAEKENIISLGKEESARLQKAPAACGDTMEIACVSPKAS